MRYEAAPSRETIDRLRSLDSLSSTLTIRSKTCGGGPSIDSKATVGPLVLLAIANELLAAPLPAQPPSAPATANTIADSAAHGDFRRHRLFDAPLIMRRSISLKS